MPTGRCSSSSTGTPPTAPAPCRTSSHPPTGGCGCSCCPATPRNSTRTSGSGRTSRPTASAAPVSPEPTTSRPRPCPRCTGCRNCPTSSAVSSPTRICGTSPPDPLTYDLLGIRVGTVHEDIETTRFEEQDALQRYGSPHDRDALP